MLAFSVLLPLAIGAGWASNDLLVPFCQICPAKMLAPLFSGDTSYLTVDFSNPSIMILTATGMLTTGLFVVGAFVKKRFWCFFCPMAALQYLIAKPALLRLVKDGNKCTRCGDCARVCDMNIPSIADDVTTRDIMADGCILCMKCIAACPETDALKLTFLGKTVFSASDRGFVSRMNKDGKP